jgi:aminopeptidase N
MSDYPFNMYCEFMCNDAVFMVSSAYGNTVQQDLWKALQEQAGIDKIVLPDTVEKIMETWTRQMGFPVINVTRSYNANNGATASQVRELVSISNN